MTDEAGSAGIEKKTAVLSQARYGSLQRFWHTSTCGETNASRHRNSYQKGQLRNGRRELRYGKAAVAFFADRWKQGNQREATQA